MFLLQCCIVCTKCLVYNGRSLTSGIRCFLLAPAVTPLLTAKWGIHYRSIIIMKTQTCLRTMKLDVWVEVERNFLAKSSYGRMIFGINRHIFFFFFSVNVRQSVQRTLRKNKATCFGCRSIAVIKPELQNTGGGGGGCVQGCCGGATH
jgi:hypothetical protein